MNSLRTTDPEIWKWLSDGNFAVKKSSIPFCELGVDHALEQVNRTMKVMGGIKGITSRPAMLARFFLAAPEMSRLSGEAD